MDTRKRGIINQVANFASVEWDNTAISDQAPSDYFAAYVARFSYDELNEMMKWHALPQGWEDMEYREFLVERRKLMAKVIREGFEKLLAQHVQMSS